MKTVLYYFTGTGNSLAVAEGLCHRLGDCELVPVASIPRDTGVISPDADRVGIVAPVYFSGLPALVADLLLRLDLSKVSYRFAVVTLGGSGGSAALHQIERILQNGPGRRGLDAGFTVKMPGNYILMYNPRTRPGSRGSSLSPTRGWRRSPRRWRRGSGGDLRCRSLAGSCRG